MYGTLVDVSVNEIKHVAAKSAVFVLAIILVGASPEIKGFIRGSTKAVHLSNVKNTSQSLFHKRLCKSFALNGGYK